MPPKKKLKVTGRPTRPQNDFLLFCEWMRSDNVGVHDPDSRKLVPLPKLSGAKQNTWFAECWNGTLAFPVGITTAGRKFNNLPDLKEYFRAKATENQPLQHALTEHTTAIQLKKGTEAPASSAATEHAETEFHIDEALAETLRSLQALGTQQPILTRVIDHACSSEHCMSYATQLFQKPTAGITCQC